MLIWVALKCLFSGLTGDEDSFLVSKREPLNGHRNKDRYK